MTLAKHLLACDICTAHADTCRETLHSIACYGLLNQCIAAQKWLQCRVCVAGRNNVSAFDNVMYLRQFKKLRLVNLAGNPIALLPDYRSYVLSHIKDLTYLDYRRVNAADVASAIEQHQV